MSNEYGLEVEGLSVRTSEVLYQCMKHPDRADIQRAILEQKSPMIAKRVARGHEGLTRPDWAEVRVEVMRWALRVKLAQNPFRMKRMLLATKAAPIVEQSARDTYWGAVEDWSYPTRVLVGVNVLGQLLMELRDELTIRGIDALKDVPAPAFSDARLLNLPIGASRARMRD